MKNFFKKLDYIALKRLFIVALLIMAILLIPDSHTKFTYIIKNESKRNIVLKNIILGTETMIEPGSFTIYNFTKETSYDYMRSDLYNNKSYCVCYGDSLKVFSSDTTLKIVKQMSNSSDWEHFDKENILNKGGEFICRFTVKDSDFK